jgi:hypothetical protein
MMMMNQFAMTETHAAQSTNLSSGETISKRFDAYNALQFATHLTVVLTFSSTNCSPRTCETRYEATSVDVFTCYGPPTRNFVLVRI